MNQFIVHSSLDIVEEVQWATPTMLYSISCLPLPAANVIRYMKCVDKFNNLLVSCFLTAGSTTPYFANIDWSGELTRKQTLNFYYSMTKKRMTRFVSSSQMCMTFIQKHS